MRKYIVYIDDNCSVYKTRVVAEDEEDARAQAHGQGEIVAIKDVTEDYPISLDKVEQALRRALFGDAEISFILETLSRENIAE